ncbi:MAG: periplasmic heavy metal sensor [Alphaproteobacteria bacterium]|nr:MAG: periplasmic heavy metal sensor [Alphaproteobacteria bacterium]
MPRPASPRRLRIALAVSLAVNLLVIGTLAGLLLRHGPPRGPDTFPVFGLRHVLRSLPEEDRAPLREAATALQAEIAPLRAQLRADRDRMAELIRTEPFDAEALRALLARQQDRLDKAAAIAADRIVATLAGLSPEARARFAEAILQPRARRRPDGGKPPHHPPPPD